MFGKNPKNNEQLDRLGQLVLRAAAADEHEIEAASTAPFLFTRIRARIAEGQREEVDRLAVFAADRLARDSGDGFDCDACRRPDDLDGGTEHRRRSALAFTKRRSPIRLTPASSRQFSTKTVCRAMTFSPLL